jgi:hypothetical protein
VSVTLALRKQMEAVASSGLPSAIAPGLLRRKKVDRHPFKYFLAVNSNPARIAFAIPAEEDCLQMPKRREWLFQLTCLKKCQMGLKPPK